MIFALRNVQHGFVFGEELQQPVVHHVNVITFQQGLQVSQNAILPIDQRALAIEGDGLAVGCGELSHVEYDP